MLQPYQADRVYDAFHLLQTEPSIQVPLLLTLTKRSNGMEIQFKILTQSNCLGWLSANVR